MRVMDDLFSEEPVKQSRNLKKTVKSQQGYDFRLVLQIQSDKKLSEVSILEFSVKISENQFHW